MHKATTVFDHFALTLNPLFASKVTLNAALGLHAPPADAWLRCWTQRALSHAEDPLLGIQVLFQGFDIDTRRFGQLLRRMLKLPTVCPCCPLFSQPLCHRDTIRNQLVHDSGRNA